MSLFGSPYGLRSWVNLMLSLLDLVKAIVVPAMAGLGDSDKTMSYVEPWDDNG